MTPFTYGVVDAFTSTPFAGNPAASFILPRGHGLSDSKLQLIAREFNLAETAFVERMEDHTPENPHYSLRWFTPTVEVPLCGHATLASAHRLFASSIENLTSDKIRFASRFSGELTAAIDPATRKITLDFPDNVPQVVESLGEEQGGLIEAFEGLEGRVVAVARHRVGILVEVEEGVRLEGLKFDGSLPQKLMKLPSSELFILTTTTTPTADSAFQIQSRVFAPELGVLEDPVTGAAHCALVPYWLGNASARSRVKGLREGDTSLLCKQVSERGGEMEVEWKEKEGRVLLSGETVLVAEGTMFV